MKAKGTLRLQSKVRYFVLIEGVYNKKHTQLQNVPIHFELIENLDGKEVEVDYSNTGGQITVYSIVCEGKTYQKVEKTVIRNNERSNRGNSNSNKSSSYAGGNQNSSNNHFSKTPYNFVPLNEKIILQSIFAKEKQERKLGFLKPDCTNNHYNKSKYTGSIKISIKNETPLFIGAYKKESKNHRGFNEIEPYRIDGEPAIPGSSIRGLLYSLVEIFGFGPMVNLVDKPVYFRSAINDFQNQTVLRFGVLSYENGNYKIYDFNDLVEKLDSRTYNRELQLIDDVNYLGLSSGNIMGRVHSFGVAKNQLDFENCKVYKSSSISRIIEDYKSDANRADQIDSRIDILKNAKGYKIKGTEIKGCPIWFGVEGEEIKSIGHAKYHRIPAPLRTVNLLSSDHKDAFDKRQNVKSQESYELSLAEMIFGTSEFRASKVRIEDAKSENAQFGEQRLLKNLQSPKIKSANLYLEARNGNPNWQKNINDQKLRGFKMHYKKSDNFEWSEEIATHDDKKRAQQQKLQSLISPIQPNAKFETSIYFNDLSNYELGALLFSLQLTEDLRHSLGMGKPYGLGRVKNKIEELKCFDFVKRYSIGSQSGETLFAPEAVKQWIKDFEAFILNEIGENDRDSLWKVDRLKNAYGLMQVRNDLDEDSKSEYMQLDSFKKKYPIIDDPNNLGSYHLENTDFLKKQL